MNKPPIKNKRFIAAATCPACGASDKIYTYDGDAGGRWRACVDCDFVESLAEEPRLATRELPTRVNVNRPGEQPLAHETPFEAVKIVDQGDAGPQSED